jgi:hypothetical protein
MDTILLGVYPAVSANQSSLDTQDTFFQDSYLRFDLDALQLQHTVSALPGRTSLHKQVEYISSTQQPPSDAPLLVDDHSLFSLLFDVLAAAGTSDRLGSGALLGPLL